MMTGSVDGSYLFSLLRLVYLFLLTNDDVDGTKPYTIDITTNAIINCNLNMFIIYIFDIIRC